jgi:hypothetical protein
MKNNSRNKTITESDAINTEAREVPNYEFSNACEDNSENDYEWEIWEDDDEDFEWLDDDDDNFWLFDDDDEQIDIDDLLYEDNDEWDNDD